MATESHTRHHDHAGHGHDGRRRRATSHVSSTQFYVGIFAALVCLTILTVKVSYYDFGSANILIAMAIATTKASLVATFFMHLRHDKLFNTLTFLAAFLFLGVFILLHLRRPRAARGDRQRLRRDGRPQDRTRRARRRAGDDRDHQRRRGRAAAGSAAPAGAGHNEKKE